MRNQRSLLLKFPPRRLRIYQLRVAIKRRLRRAGVRVDPKASTAKLIELWQKHLK